MTTPDTQDRPIPSVPEGTPGRDWRAGLPAAQPPGAQQPWRRLGPGNRTWIVIITVLACVVLAVVAVIALIVGVASTAFDRKGVLVLDPGEYRTSQSSCAGSGPFAAIEGGSAIVFTDGSNRFEATLDKGQLKQGRCQLPFDLSALNAQSGQTYKVSVGDVDATSVSGDELLGTDTVVVFVAPR
jgi:hypothetical protein